MQKYESFGDCLKRALKEADLSASEAARLVGFRSRNSIFRILGGDASSDVKQRFLTLLYEALGDRWPRERWQALQEALSVERLGPERYRANRAFQQVLQEKDGGPSNCTVHITLEDGTQERPLAEVLREIASSARVEIVITGCCEGGLMALLAQCCGDAGARGTLTIRHYIDTEEDTVSQNILGILPLVSKPWYNARLVGNGSCPAEMMAIYRLNAIYVHRWDEQGTQYSTMFVRYDESSFATRPEKQGSSLAVGMLDRWRFHLELLKPLPNISAGPEMFVEYTRQYAQLEAGCTILSIKPDVHFNCIHAAVLEQSIIEGFEQSGMAAGPELIELVGALKAVHEQRFRNMVEKHKATHLIYSLPAMERFMRTGVLSDQFFIQRAYTVEERRQCIRMLLDTMREQPYFNVHFLREDMLPLQYEISFYDGKGVMLMDAYTSYDLDTDHSEALITLPAFIDAFQRYFMDELLAHDVLSRGESIAALERLLVMNVQE